MGPLIGEEVGAVEKVLPAGRILTELPFPVGLLVLGQGRAAGEASPTLGTLLEPPHGVDVLMVDQVGAVTKFLSTFPTHERLFPSVGVVVKDEAGASPEVLPAFQAHRRLFPSVDLLAMDEIGALAEAPPTFLTLKVPFPCVHPLVNEEVRAAAEALPTFFQGLVGHLPTRAELGCLPKPGCVFPLRVPWARFAGPPPAGSSGLFPPVDFMCPGATQNSLFHEVLSGGFVLPDLRP